MVLTAFLRLICNFLLDVHMRDRLLNEQSNVCERPSGKIIPVRRDQFNYLFSGRGRVIFLLTLNINIFTKTLFRNILC